MQVGVDAGRLRRELVGFPIREWRASLQNSVQLVDRGTHRRDAVAQLEHDVTAEGLLGGTARRGRLGFVVHEVGFHQQCASLAHPLLARSEEHTSELQSLMRISY